MEHCSLWALAIFVLVVLVEKGRWLILSGIVLVALVVVATMDGVKWDGCIPRFNANPVTSLLYRCARGGVGVAASGFDHMEAVARDTVAGKKRLEQIGAALQVLGLFTFSCG